jgi:hypothetical protein
MPEAGNPITTPPLRLGTHPRHPDRPALLDADGHATTTFAAGATRDEIARGLAAAGYLLHDDDTVTRTEPATAVPEPIPTVFDLGRHLAGLWDRLTHHDELQTKSRENTDAHRQAEADYKAVDEEIEAIEALIFARPVRSLADGAALAVTAYRSAEFLSAIEATSDCKSEIGHLVKALARLSILLTEAAGLPATLLTGPDSAALIARYASTGEAVA